MIRAQTKLEFAWGLALPHGEPRSTRSASRRPAACWARSGHVRRVRAHRRVRRRAAAREYGNGLWACDVAGPPCMPCARRCRLVPAVQRDHPPDRLAQSSTTPTAAALADEDAAAADRQYLPGRTAWPTPRQRSRLFRLAWDFAGTALASRNEQYERFYLGSSPRNLARHLAFADRSRADRLVDRFLKKPY